MEYWRDIAGFEGRYQVSDQGRVRNVRSGRLLVACASSNGYPHVSLYYADGSRANVAVHRAVAQAFLPNPLFLPQINHIDSDRANPALTNLEWVTNQENHAHASRAGRKAHGENNGNAKLTAEKVLAMRAAGNTQRTKADIAREFDVSHKLVSMVLTRTIWKHV